MSDAARPSAEPTTDRDITADEVKFLADTVRDMVHIRLNAGHHPDDVLMSAASMFEDTVTVWVDGSLRGDDDDQLHTVTG